MRTHDYACSVLADGSNLEREKTVPGFDLSRRACCNPREDVHFCKA